MKRAKPDLKVVTEEEKPAGKPFDRSPHVPRVSPYAVNENGERRHPFDSQNKPLFLRVLGWSMATARFAR